MGFASLLSADTVSALNPVEQLYYERGHLCLPLKSPLTEKMNGSIDSQLKHDSF